MTYQDAYLDGFCKAAEAAGVDPVALYKRADAKAKILGLLATAGKPFATAGRAVKTTGGNVARRYAQLLRGGNPETLSTGRQLLDGSLKNRLRVRLARILGRNTAPEISSEARKALATQVGTGIAGAGALTGAGYGINSALSNG